MTDKQIIYDDVDVKDCIAYAKLQTVSLGDTVCKQMEKVCMVKNQPCKFFDCQFKQMARELKAKEQECEELKKVNEEKNELLAKLGCPTIATARMKAFTLEQQLDQFKADNDSLKSELMQTYCYLDADKETIDQLRAENEELKQRLHQCWKVENSFVEQIDQLRKRNNQLVEQNFELAQKYTKLEKETEQLKQTLIEIKEIATCCIEGNVARIRMKQILQKNQRM